MRRIGADVFDVIDQRAARWIQLRQIPDALCNFMVGAGGIAAHAEPADDPALRVVKRHPPSEADDPAGDFPVSSSLPLGRGQEFGIERIRLVQAIEGVTRLGQKIEVRGGEGENIERIANKASNACLLRFILLLLCDIGLIHSTLPRFDDLLGLFG